MENLERSTHSYLIYDKGDNAVLKNYFSMSGSGLIGSVYGKTMFLNRTKNYCPIYSGCKEER